MKSCWLALMLAGLAGCGGSNASSPAPGSGDGPTVDTGASDGAGRDDAAVDAGTYLVGSLVGGTGSLPGPIAGVHYQSGAQAGFTDAQGAFRYQPSAPIVFAVADVTFRPVMGRPKLSPWQLVGTGACVDSEELQKLLVLLYSLDADGDPATGTALTPFPSVTPTRTLSSMSFADVQALVGQLIPGRSALSPAQAVDLFIRQVDDEAWAQIGMDTFSGGAPISRSQGVATDGMYWYFSGRLSLETTDLQFNTIRSNAFAIPIMLALAGSSHIGDIDVYNGQIYAPIEDPPGYRNPVVVLYGTQDLSAGTTYSIPQSLQTAGVPWVAVDGPRSLIYLAEWDPSTQLNLFALSNGQYLRSLRLTPPAGTPFGRIQGAKVFEGGLYLSTDDSGKTVYKLDLETGTVLRLFSVSGGAEMEGLAFLARPDGSLMHTLNVATSSTAMEMRHHSRTRPPLRAELCP